MAVEKAALLLQPKAAVKAEEVARGQTQVGVRVFSVCRPFGVCDDLCGECKVVEMMIGDDLFPPQNTHTNFVIVFFVSARSSSSQES